MPGDSRKDFILVTTANYFSLASGDVQSLQKSEALNSFLDDGNATVLAGKMETRGGRKGLDFQNRVRTGIKSKILD